MLGKSSLQMRSFYQIKTFVNCENLSFHNEVISGCQSYVQDVSLTFRFALLLTKNEISKAETWEEIELEMVCWMMALTLHGNTGNTDPKKHRWEEFSICN